MMDTLSGLSLSTSPGYCIGVSSRGSAPEFIFGGSCTGDGTDISAETIWEAASLSKPVVALMALEREIHDPGFLVRPLQTNPKSFGAADDVRWNELNLLHALTHTTGFPNWRPEGRRLLFENDPGTPGYSGEGYELLLSELSARAGIPTGALLDEHLRHLGMITSSFKPGIAFRQGEVAVGHDESGNALPKRWPAAARASGTLHTMVEDYLRFVSAVSFPGLIEAPGLRAAAMRMSEPSFETADGHGRTLGWAFTNTSAGGVLWQHGDNPGFKHLAAVRPATREALVVFTNSDAGQTLCRQVCRQVLQVDIW